MIFLMNAMMMAMAALFWSNRGGLNIGIRLLFVLYAVMNAALAAPVVARWFL